MLAACSGDSETPPSGEAGADAVTSEDASEDSLSAFDDVSSTDSGGSLDASGGEDGTEGLGDTPGDDAADSGDDAATPDPSDTGSGDVGADASGDTSADAGPDVPFGPVMVEASTTDAEIEQTTIWESPAVAATATESGSVLVDADEVQLFDGDGLTAFGAAPAGVMAAAGIGGDTALLLAADGPWVASAEQIAVSPVGASLDGEVPIAVLAVPGESGPDVWLATDAGVWLWRGGLVYPLELNGVDLGGATLAYGANFDGTPALWLGTASGLIAVIETDAGIDAWIVREDLAGPMTVDGLGQLWVVADGDVHQRSPDGQWTWYRLPAAVSGVTARTDGPNTWFETDEVLWFQSGGGWRPLTGISGDLLALDATGRALVTSGAAVLRVGVDAEPEPEPDPITWQNDVLPIFENSCSKCHGEGKYAHPLYLPEQWQAEITNILLVVESQAMPLPPNDPLTVDEIEVISDWQAGGFLIELPTE